MKQVKQSISRVWIRNTDGVPSMSATFAAIAFFVTTAVYIVSMFEKIGPVSIRAFDPSLCAAYLTPVLTLYFSRRFTDAKLGTSVPNVVEDPTAAVQAQQGAAK